MNKYFLILGVLLLVGCSSKTLVIEYNDGKETRRREETKSAAQVIADDLKGKTLVVFRSGWGLDLSSVSVSSTPGLEISAGRLTTLYVSHPADKPFPEQLPELLRSAQSVLEIDATGIKDGAKEEEAK